jgi:hypothetical protein
MFVWSYIARDLWPWLAAASVVLVGIELFSLADSRARSTIERGWQWLAARAAAMMTRINSRLAGLAGGGTSRTAVRYFGGVERPAGAQTVGPPQSLRRTVIVVEPCARPQDFVVSV